MALKILNVFYLVCVILLFSICDFTQGYGAEEFIRINQTSFETTQHDVAPKEMSYLPLLESLRMEESQWHWYPYRRINYHLSDAGLTIETVCDREPAMNDFPNDLFTHEQRLRGAIILHFLVALYFLIMLATICDRYFLPSVECICLALSIPTNVAAATFMALATTIPEFFTNTISTFVTESDMGFGTIIGSMLFNTLGVSACAALAAPGHVQLDWWPISRDSVLFSINLTMLSIFIWDGQVDWWEGMIQVGMLLFYFAVMFQNARLERFFTKYVSNWFCCRNVNFDTENNHDTTSNVSNNNEKPATEGVSNPAFEKSPSDGKQGPAGGSITGSTTATSAPSTSNDDEDTLWAMPKGSRLSKGWYVLTWPIRLLLTVTIPNVTTYPKLFPLTFIMCMVLLAMSSYVIFWMVAIIGFTFGIPESVMGMTLLAAGGCLPEAASAVIMVRTGSGALGVSNSLGANSLAIMFSLGLPWFVRIMVDGGPSTGAHFLIRSSGIEFIVISIILAVMVLYAIITIAKYMLRTTVGFILALCYVIFVTYAILVELNVLFDTGNNC